MNGTSSAPVLNGAPTGNLYPAKVTPYSEAPKTLGRIYDESDTKHPLDQEPVQDIVLLEHRA